MPKREVIKPTPEEITAAARTVEASIDPETGQHPEELFNAISCTVPRMAAELAIFSLDKQQILLTDRGPDDPYWPNKYCLPGVILINKDVTEGRYDDPFDNAAVRAIDELEGTRITSLIRLSPKYVKETIRMGPRGAGLQVFYGGLMIDEEPAVGRMFDIDDLQEPAYEAHFPLIRAAQRGMTLGPAMDVRII